MQKMSIVERVLLGIPVRQTPKLLPGLLLALTIMVIATWLSDFIGSDLMGFDRSPISAIMVAIVIGLAIRNTLGLPEVLRPGVDFCVRKVLRFGIILMGVRLSILELLKIGVAGLPIVLVCITVGLALTLYISRLVKLPRRLGTLIAVGTGICGASAIVATAPGIDASDEETAYAIATITVFGVIAMLLYPYLTYLIFSGNQIMAGLLLGASIHETAQVAGAGLIYDSQFLPMRPTAADMAIVVKLVRNALMAVAIPVMILVHNRQLVQAESSNGQRTSFARLFPMFILGFILLAALRSVGDAGVQTSGTAFGAWSESMWLAVHRSIAQWAGYLLAIAMAGVGLGASYKGIRELGIRPFYVGLFAAALVGIVATVLIVALGPSITF